ncbi:hypothetical protein F0562_006754 [Nyssa sinensis]|uniref:Uncharacterized protein n=1 Tax=Nyssa sinensis TaxID=561372 RepID=A0A5J5AP76_9ASTE|nr:hypothetical protein F0562_006754 [Nyssa sinensis]
MHYQLFFFIFFPSFLFYISLTCFLSEREEEGNVRGVPWRLTKKFQNGIPGFLDQVNLLGPVTRHHLNNLVFFVFTPSLVASNLADTITTSNIVSLTPRQLHGLVIGCCAAGNLGNLLLIIIPAVCEESNSPFGDSSTCSTDGEAYASLSMAIGAVYIWSYVYNIVRVYGKKSNGDINIDDSKISIQSSRETSEMDSESCTEALLSNELPKLCGP